MEKVYLYHRIYGSAHDAAEIVLLNEEKTLYAAQKGNLTLNESLSLLSIVLRFVEKHKPASMVVDASRMEAFLPKFSDQIIHHFLPQIIGLGVERIAVIPPQSVYTQMNMDEMRQNFLTQQAETPVLQQIVTRACSSLESALRWINETTA